MRIPMPLGSAIDDARIDSWVARFKFYRLPPDRKAIQEWLKRFKVSDRDLAARILDVVEIKSEVDIQNGYSAALTSLAGWHLDPGKRTGKWFFVGFGRAGESGQSMLRIFREATRMNSNRFQSLFCSTSDLVNKALTASDTVALDNHAASGPLTTFPVLGNRSQITGRC